MNPFVPLLLLALWLLVWGELSVANVVSGVIVVTLLLLAFPPRLRRTAGVRLHPLAMARLAAYVGRQLVVSNALVAREVLSRRSRIRTGVVGHELESTSELALTLLANILALSPGTMTVDVTRDPPTLYVHFLLLSDVEAARETIRHLEHLVMAAVEPRPAAADDGPGGTP